MRGLFEVTNDDLGLFVIKNQDAVESICNPTERQIESACREYAVDPRPIINMIRQKEKGVHTFVLDVPVYREGLRKEAQKVAIRPELLKLLAWLSKEEYCMTSNPDDHGDMGDDKSDDEILEEYFKSW